MNVHPVSIGIACSQHNDSGVVVRVIVLNQYLKKKIFIILSGP